jgi:hypothetical protein
LLDIQETVVGMGYGCSCPGSCLMAGFDIGDVEPLVSATRVLVYIKAFRLSCKAVAIWNRIVYY